MVTDLWHNHEVNQVMERITTSETGIVAHKEMLDTGEVENERPCQETLKFGPEAEITWITRDRQTHCERAKNQGTRLFMVCEKSSDSTVPIELRPYDAVWVERSSPWRYFGLCGQLPTLSWGPWTAEIRYFGS